MLKRFILILIISAIALNASNFRNGMKAYKKSNYTDAKAFFKTAAIDDESAAASYMLGRMYLNGEGVEENTKKAVQFLLHASDYGNIPAGCYLSEAYMKEGSNLALLAVGLIKGLRKRVPHCKVVLKQYNTYKFPTTFNFENTVNY